MGDFGAHCHLKMPTNPYAQSGGEIDASMASACLENLETLSKREVDMEVIYNTVGIVYVGMSCPATAPSSPS